MAGAALGDVGASPFLAGTAFGEILRDSQSAKCCNFRHNMRCRGGKSKLCERTGSVLQFHGRIMFGSFSTRPPLQMSLFAAGAAFGDVAMSFL